jgi:hypothetical protein
MPIRAKAVVPCVVGHCGFGILVSGIRGKLLLN